MNPYSQKTNSQLLAKLLEVISVLEMDAPMTDEWSAVRIAINDAECEGWEADKDGHWSKGKKPTTL